MVFYSVYIFYKSWVCSLNMLGNSGKFRRYYSREPEERGSSEVITHGNGKNREVQKQFLVTLHTDICLLGLQILSGTGILLCSGTVQSETSDMFFLLGSLYTMMVTIKITSIIWPFSTFHPTELDKCRRQNQIHYRRIYRGR